jgi:dTMP kinase
MAEGKLIVLEGVDGAGTTTQCARLCAALQARTSVRDTREPSIGPVGALLRQALTGRWVSPVAGATQPPHWVTLALLFAADRQDHLEVEVLPLLAAGTSVVSDRYYHSSVAYQSLSAGAGSDAVGWIRELNRHARRPDLTIVLDVPAAVAEERRKLRGGRELFDDAGLQRRLVDFYARLDSHFPGENIAHVAGDRSPDEVAAAVLAHVQPLL